MRVVIGLGNPGRQHVYDRHNVGFLVLDEMARRLGVAIRRATHHARVAEVSFAGDRVLLVKPQTYMNTSGQAAASIARYYRLASEMFVAVYDDMDLPVGRIRIRPGGGAGGHRGLQSLIAHLGDGSFSRVRIGIGRPPVGSDAATHVLTAFRAAERDAAEAAVTRAAEAVETLIAEGANHAMNRFNA